MPQPNPNYHTSTPCVLFIYHYSSHIDVALPLRPSIWSLEQYHIHEIKAAWIWQVVNIKLQYRRWKWLQHGPLSDKHKQVFPLHYQPLPSRMAGEWIPWGSLGLLWSAAFAWLPFSMTKSFLCNWTIFHGKNFCPQWSAWLMTGCTVNMAWAIVLCSKYVEC